MIHQYGETGDGGEIQMIGRESDRVLDQDTVIRNETREAFFGGWQRQRLAHRIPIPVNREVAKGDAPAVAAAQNRTAVKVGSGSKRAVIPAGNGQVVGAVGNP